jgi:hypothetical protein
MIISYVFRFKRPSQFDAYLSHNVDVLPSSFNCELQKSLDICMDLPGCIHCLWQDGEIRTLGAVSADVDGESESNSEQQFLRNYYYDSARRRLYPKILPDFAGIDDYETDEGFCLNGFGNSACPLEVSAAPNSLMWNVYSIFGFVSLCITSYLVTA